MDPSPPGEGLISNSLEGCGHVTGDVGHRRPDKAQACVPAQTLPGTTNVRAERPALCHRPWRNGVAFEPLGGQCRGSPAPWDLQGVGASRSGCSGPRRGPEVGAGAPQSQARPWAVHVPTAARGGGGRGRASPANRRGRWSREGPRSQARHPPGQPLQRFSPPRGLRPAPAPAPPSPVHLCPPASPPHVTCVTSASVGCREDGVRAGGDRLQLDPAWERGRRFRPKGPA